MSAGCKHYDFDAIESFWQKFWDEQKTFCVQENAAKEKYYVLDMFPYPSGTGLHIGHPEGYTASDILARYKRMKGFNVLHPMGWDAFGLPAEQHAINTGVDPETNTSKNISVFKKQIKRIGFAIDWDREINTTDPGYFKWTQWIFLQLLKHGLAYVDEKPVWWCESLKSVLANEEVINGLSERGNFPVQRRNLRQWVLRITKYADKLLDGLQDIDWPESTKRQQVAWIGKSEGATVKFKIVNSEEDIEVYTTRPDTLFGATYLAIAPEHSIVPKITTPENQNAVSKYIELSKSKSDLERTDLAKTKSGVRTGAYAINPINGKHIEIWVADYVLISYGSGAVMAVPAHDTRDYEFAKQYNLPVIPVIDGAEELPYLGDGLLMNSGKFSGLTSQEARQLITAALQEDGNGKFTTNYKLRDWVFSRQRYWGEPIPIIWISKEDYDRCASDANFYFREFLPVKPVVFEKNEAIFCALPLTTKELPLELPKIQNYLPSSDGESPLSNVKSWTNVYVNFVTGEIVTAEEFSGRNSPEHWLRGQRETNTMPQWAGSCWYYLRYLSPNYKLAPFSDEALNYWRSPDMYIGGAEHAVLHLLYARFWHKFLCDIAVIKTGKEPFQRLFHQGIILGEDGTKMSKSRGNVINPDVIIDKYGADALRLYEMFLGPLDMMKPWSSRGIEGVFRFLKKIWTTYIDDDGNVRPFQSSCAGEAQKVMHETIKKAGTDIEDLKFNTAISQMMICLNCIQKHDGFDKFSAESFLKILSPFAPHVAEELWARIGNKSSIAHAQWPMYDESKMASQTIRIAVQVNGKTRAECEISNEMASNEDVFRVAAEHENIAKYIVGRRVIRKIYVKGKILNILTD